LLSPAIEVELRVELKTRADDEAITIFGRNLEQLLLSSPAGEKRVIGLDPGFRTGVKVAVVSATGALVHTDTLYLHQEDRFAGAIRALLQRFTDLLLGMRYDDPEVRPLLDLEGLKAWRPGRTSGYALLERGCEQFGWLQPFLRHMAAG
jgi:transcriptional accessory protein Tex/SPT6